MEPSAPGWYPDPSGRHERRYWSGIRWSRHVDDGGQRDEDPLDTGPVATVRGARLPTGEQPPVPFREGDDRGLDGGRGEGWATSLPPSSAQPPFRATRRDPFAADPRPTRTSARPTRTSARSGRAARSSGDTHSGMDGPAPRRWLPVAVAAVAVLGIAGAAFTLLGGDDAPADSVVEDDPVELAMIGVVNDRAGGTITEDQATCMAQAFVETAGRDRLVELGVLEGEEPLLSTDEIEVAIPRSFDCLDDETMLAFMTSTWGEDTVGGLDPAIAPCVFQGWFDALGRDRLLYLYARFVRADPPPLDEILEPAEFDSVTATLGRCQETPPGEAPPAP